MLQQAKEIVAKPDDLSVIPGLKLEEQTNAKGLHTRVHTKQALIFFHWVWLHMAFNPSTRKAEPDL